MYRGFFKSNQNERLLVKKENEEEKEKEDEKEKGKEKEKENCFIQGGDIMGCGIDFENQTITLITKGI